METKISAEEDLRLVQERYNLGAATILDLLNAQVSLIILLKYGGDLKE